MDIPYIELFAGSQQAATTLVHFAADADVIQEFTPLMLADNGEFEPWDGQEPGKAVYLTSYPVDTSKQRSAQCHKTGIFNIAAVDWPGNVDIDAKKCAAFVSSGVSVQLLARQVGGTTVTNESVMTLPLASKFKAGARATADRGLSTYGAIYQFNKLEEQDKPRADAVVVLDESGDYQSLSRAMVSVPCIDVGTAKSILSITIEQGRPKVVPELTAASEDFTDMHSPQAISTGMAYDGRDQGDDGDIDHILKII